MIVAGLGAPAGVDAAPGIACRLTVGSALRVMTVIAWEVWLLSRHAEGWVTAALGCADRDVRSAPGPRPAFMS